MTSNQQTGLSSDRIRGPPGVKTDYVVCCICHDILWKPVACQSCETPFCSVCIHKWLASNPAKCPKRCPQYIERKCPPIVATMLAELQVSCLYQSNSCNQVIPYEGLEKHEAECDFKPKRCKGCQTQILTKDFSNHENSCPLVHVTCPDCKLSFKRNEFDSKHTENMCLKGQIRQLRFESRDNKSMIRELMLQLNEMRILNPSIAKSRITFHDLPNAAGDSKFIPHLYYGLKWNNIYYGQLLHLRQKNPRSGYAMAFNATDSSTVAVFMNNASISVVNPGRRFTLSSLTACAAWNDNLLLVIHGYRGSQQTNQYMTKLLFGKPQMFLLTWKDIDRITLESSGGTAHPGSGGTAEAHVIITQVTVDSLN